MYSLVKLHTHIVYIHRHIYIKSYLILSEGKRALEKESSRFRIIQQVICKAGTQIDQTAFLKVHT